MKNLLKLIHDVVGPRDPIQPHKERWITHLPSNHDSAAPACTASGKFVVIGSPDAPHAEVCKACERILDGEAALPVFKYRDLLEGLESL